MPSGTKVSSFLVFASYYGWKGAWPAMKRPTALSLAQSSGSGVAVGSSLWPSLTFLNGMHFFPAPFLPCSSTSAGSSWLVLNAAHKLLAILLLVPPTRPLSSGIDVSQVLDYVA